MSHKAPDVSVSLGDLSPILSSCLQEGQEVILTIKGTSMRPLLYNLRDQVVLRAVDGSALRPGDVPLYLRRNGVYVLHRVVARDDGTRCEFLDGSDQSSTQIGEEIRYTMLGDAQTELEHGITPTQILGVAVAFIRNGKRIECDSAPYQRYVRWWYRLLFVRRQLMFIHYVPYRLVRKFRGWIGK